MDMDFSRAGAKRGLRRWAGWFETPGHRWLVGGTTGGGGLALITCGFVARDQTTVRGLTTTTVGSASIGFWVLGGLLLVGGLSVLIFPPFLLRGPKVRRVKGKAMDVGFPSTPRAHFAAERQAVPIMESQLERNIRTASETIAGQFRKTLTPEPEALLSMPEPPMEINVSEMFGARGALDTLGGKGRVVQGQATGSTAAVPPNPKVLAGIRSWYQAPGAILSKWPEHIEALNDAVEEPFWLAESIQHRNSLLDAIRDAISRRLGQ